MRNEKLRWPFSIRRVNERLTASLCSGKATRRDAASRVTRNKTRTPLSTYFLHLFSLSVLALALPASAATTRYVSTAGDDANAGTQDKPWRTISHAAVASEYDDTILVAGGLYEESVTNNVSKGGMYHLNFRGGYDTDWNRDLKNCPSIVKPPSSSLPCWFIENAINIRVSGFVLTGGQHGIIARGSSASNADASYRSMSNVDTFNTVLTQLIVTNNVGSGIVIGNSTCQEYVPGDGCVIASCLVADNGQYGIVPKLYSSVYYRILNCTVCGNKGAGIYLSGVATGMTVAENSIFRDNANWDFCLDSNYSLGVLRRCFVGTLYTARNYSTADGRTVRMNNVPLAGVFRMDPGLVADGSLASDSYCVKAGFDLREHPWVGGEDFINEDVYGTPWNGEYDIGAVKSTGANQRGFAASQDVYVATDGDDAAAGTEAAPVATIEEGVYRTAANGTCHVGAGEWTSRASLFLPGQRLVGAGMGKTIFRKCVDSEPALVVGESFTRVSDITFQDVPTAIRLDPYLVATTNVLVDHCAFQGSTNGIYRQDGYGNGSGEVFPPGLAESYNRGLELESCLFRDCVYGLYFRARHTVVYRSSNCVFAYNDYGIYDDKTVEYARKRNQGQIDVHSTFVSNRNWAVYWVSDGAYPGVIRHYNSVFKGQKGIRVDSTEPIILVNCCFDCEQNTLWPQGTRFRGGNDNTNTSFSAVADIDVIGKIPGRPNLGSALSRVGASVASVWGEDLASDFDDAARDPDGIDLGAYVSPETKKILNPKKTHYVKITATPTTYGEPEPAYGTQVVEEGQNAFAITNGCVRYEDGATALFVGEGLRNKVMGYTYTPEDGTAVVKSDAYFTYDVQTNAECLWRWEYQCKVIVDAGRNGSTVSVNGSDYAPAVTNWYPVGGSLSVNFKQDEAAETFVGWTDSDGGSPSSTTQFVYTAGKPITLTVKCRVNHFVTATGSDETGTGLRANPWRTIHHAIESSSTKAGDVIYVGGGLYEESVTNNVDKGGKHQLTFKGGYRADWTRDLKNCPSIVKPTSNKLPCWYIENSVSNRVSGFVFTGGQYGIIPRGRSASSATGRGNIRACSTVVSQLIVTNNVKCGIMIGNTTQNEAYVSGDDCAVASCLVASNGTYGISPNLYAASPYIRILNCTVYGNKSGGIVLSSCADSRTVVENCILYGNTGWDFNVESRYTRSVLRRCFADTINTACYYSKTAGRISDMRNMPLDGVFHADPGLAADGSLASDSYCVKAGLDLREHPWVGSEDFIDEDVYGTPWNGEYDIGAVKSAGANQRGFAASQDVYVATDGDDAAAGTEVAPVATIEEGVYRTATNGTCHVGAGEWTSRASLFLPGQRLVGAGRGKTVFRKYADSEPALVVGESFTRVSGITFQDVPTAILLNPYLVATTNVTVDHCAFQHSTNGIFRQDGFTNRSGEEFPPGLSESYDRGVELAECVFKDCVYGLYFRARHTVVYRTSNCVFAYNDYGIYDDKTVEFARKRNQGQIDVHSTFVSNRNWAVYWVSEGAYPGIMRHYNSVFKGKKGIRIDTTEPIILVNCCFDCEQNTQWVQGTRFRSSYDDTNTIFSASAEIDVGGAIPGRPRFGSPLTHAGGSIVSVWGADLTTDVRDKPRYLKRPNRIDIGAHTSATSLRQLRAGAMVIVR